MIPHSPYDRWVSICYMLMLMLIHHICGGRAEWERGSNSVSGAEKEKPFTLKLKLVTLNELNQVPTYLLSSFNRLFLFWFVQWAVQSWNLFIHFVSLVAVFGVLIFWGNLKSLKIYCKLLTYVPDVSFYFQILWSFSFQFVMNPFSCVI